MTTVTRFEDLIAWQEARKLVKLAYAITSKGSFTKDFEMKEQFQSAALSAMTNIAEGFDNESSIEFARFLGMARRSAVEVQSLCYAAIDVNHINQEDFQICYDQAKKLKPSWRVEEGHSQKPSSPRQTLVHIKNVKRETWNLKP